MAEVTPMRGKRAGHRPFCYCCNSFVPVTRQDDRRELARIIAAEMEPDDAA